MPAPKLRITLLAFGLGECLLQASDAWKESSCKHSSAASLNWSSGWGESFCKIGCLEGGLL